MCLIRRLIKITFCLLFLLGYSLVARSQEITIQEDPAIRDLMDKYRIWSAEEPFVMGWRIQIINTDDRRKMENALENFRKLFPEIPYTKWRQVSPYYKAIIGAYESKLDALAFLQDVKQHFPSAIPVIEKIEKKELLEY